MITIKDGATIINISEFREKNKSDKIFRNLKDHKVIVEKHNSPVAVMSDYEQYEKREKLIEFAEDYVLGLLAKQREESEKKEDYIDMDQW